MTAGGARQTYLYDPASHRLTTADGKSRRYDAAGNTIGIGDATLDYDAAGHLASASEQGRVLVSYGYDADGQRIARTESGKATGLMLYDEAGRWLADYDTAGKVTRQAVWMGDYLIGLVEGTTLYYVEPDHLGTPRAVIDPARNATVWRWRPSDDPFGSVLPDEDPDADGTRFVFDMRFPGQRYDGVTGLHYNYRRDYDPATGRYIQVDPIGLAGGINPYVYVGGSPLSRIDPLGLADQQYKSEPVIETAEMRAARDRLTGLATQAAQTIDSTCGVRCLLPWIRGTLIHSEFKRLVDTTCPASMYRTEVSYKNGTPANYGESGSSRADVVFGPIRQPFAVYDLKTGRAYITIRQANAYGANLPTGTPISEIYPDGR
jgi:RHS repeat-associated protein